MKRSTVFLLLLVLVNIALFMTSPWFFGRLGKLEDWPTSGYIFGGLAVEGCLTILVGVWVTIQRIRQKDRYPALLGPTLIVTGLVVAGSFGIVAALLKACYVDGLCV